MHTFIIPMPSPRSQNNTNINDGDGLMCEIFSVRFRSFEQQMDERVFESMNDRRFVNWLAVLWVIEFATFGGLKQTPVVKYCLPASMLFVYVHTRGIVEFMSVSYSFLFISNNSCN